MKTMKGNVWAILMIIGLLSLTGLSGQKNGPIAEKIDMKTQLAGAPISSVPVPSSTGQPTGFAQYTQYGPSKQFTVFVSNMALADGTTLLVLADNHVMGKIQIFNAEGKFTLDTRNGDIVPNMTLGSSVVITDPVGKTMVAGVF